jgi:hypothetical protein
MSSEEDYSGYNLYRVDWEEKVAEDTWSPAFAYVPSKEDIDLSNWGDGAETRNAISRLASDVEEEAYQCGFEDGFDVSTVQHRLAEMKKPLPVNTGGCGCGH